MNEKIIVIIVIILWIMFIRSENRREKEDKLYLIKKKQEEDLNKQKELEVEIKYIEDANKHLPNIMMAMDTLKQRYKCNQILGTIYISKPHIDLLTSISNNKNFKTELPDMQADNFSKNESAVIRQVKNDLFNSRPFYSENDYYDEVMTYGVDAYSKTPTVQTLNDLYQYIDYKIVNESKKCYRCKLTKKGQALIDFYYSYCFKDNITELNFLSPKAQKCIAKIINESLMIIENT